MRRSGFARRGIGRLAVLMALGLLATSVALPITANAAPPEGAPQLVTEGDSGGGGDGSAAAHTRGQIRDLGRKPSDALEPSGRAYIPGVVLVGFRDGSSAAERAAARRAAKATGHQSVSKLARGLERLQLEPGTSVESAIRALHGRKGVRFAEPDYILTADHAPDDWVYTGAELWGMESGGYGSAADGAWAANEVGSRDVYVGIIDTGIDISHKDLAPNIWTNPFETAGNGIDDDGNGYADDVHGWDFFHGDASAYDSAAADYHGTHVAGTIGGVGHNGDGVVGVSWAVTMIPAKFIHGEGSTSGAIEAIDYLTDLKVSHGLNIVATNNSWGGDENSTALQDAINRGGDADILFVASAGNAADDVDTAPGTFPVGHTCVEKADHSARGYDCLIGVAAITETGALASFSNYGATSVDIGAPGQMIASTYPGNNYVYLNGTSMAAPHVTGALALLASCQASPTPDGLQDSLYATAVATPSLAGITTTEARLDVAAMMADCDTGGPPRALITGAAGGIDGIGPVGFGPQAEFWIFFSEGVTGLEIGDFTLGGTSTGWTVDMVGGTSGGASYAITILGTSPPAGTLTVTLAAGAVDGLTQPGPTGAASMTTIVDRSAPTVTAPVSSIRTGVSLAGAAIPLQLTWTASDTGTGLRYFEIHYSQDGGASWFYLTEYHIGTTALVNVYPSGSMRFRVRGFDWAGHASSAPGAAGPNFSPRLAQNTSTSITYSGTWALGKSSSFSAGSVRYTSIGGRSATYSFTGRSIGFVTTLASSRGVVKIKLDGVLVARIDVGRTPTVFRRLVWAKTFSSVKAHKVQVIVIGGYGRVDLDAFAVLK